MNRKKEEFLFHKILGAWIGKIAGGTFGQPVEGLKKFAIQKLEPPLGGWIPEHMSYVILPNDDEQYELIVLLTLEDLNDEVFKEKLRSNTLLESPHLGKYWQKYLYSMLMFTAEKYAYQFVKKYKLPWEHAGDDLYINPEDNKAYGNPYFDWIGAQMKGEIFGMFCPAWDWHSNQSTPKKDLALLKPCLDLSLQDALMAHRGVAVIGELFISAMIAVAIAHNPLKYKQEVTYPDFSKERSYEKLNEEIEQIGVCSERIISDIKRIKAVLLEYDKVSLEDVQLYFTFIDPVITFYERNPNPALWEKPWEKCVELWNSFEQKMIEDAEIKFKDYPDILKNRLSAINLKKNGNKLNIHTLFNNSTIVIGLLYGDGDFSQTCRIATECGEDTDCNVGNAGAILGAYLGHGLIPSYIKRFIRGEIAPAIKKWKDKSLYNLSKRTLTQALRFQNIINKLH